MNPSAQSKTARSTSWLPTAVFVLLFTLACADVLSLPIAGGNFRIFYAVGMFAALVRIRRARIETDLAMRAAILCVSLTPAIVFSIDAGRSGIYLVWIGLTLVCTFGVFPSLLRFNAAGSPMVGDSPLYDLILYAFRFQIVAGMILWAAGVHERTQFLYYEPSYFSISLAIYVAIVASRIRAKQPFRIDALLITAYLLTSESGAFVIVLLLTALLHLPRLRMRYLLAASVVLLVLGTAYVALVDDLNTVLVKSLLSGEADSNLLLLRGGNRLSRLMAAWEVFADNPGFGIGLGAFVQAAQTLDLDAPGTEDYLSSDGLPAVNIYLEILATAGVVGLIGFTVFLWPLMRWIFGKGSKSPLSSGTICMLLILTLESNYLRPYLWVGLALCWAEMRLASRTARQMTKEHRALVAGHSQ